MGMNVDKRTSLCAVAAEDFEEGPALNNDANAPPGVAPMHEKLMPAPRGADRNLAQIPNLREVIMFDLPAGRWMG